MKLFILFVLSTFCSAGYSQSGIISISKNQLHNASFNKLDSLEEEFKNVEVVALGEASHFGGATFEAKTFMVKFLHEQCGFNILAMESPIYEMSIISEALYSDSLSAKTFFWNNSRVWNVKELDELFAYILETYKTKTPLRCVGFNTWSFGKRGRGIGNLLEDYKKFISELEEKSNSNLEADSSFYEAVNKNVEYSGSLKKLSPSDTTLLFDKILEVNKALQKIDYKDDEYFSFWANMSDDLLAMYRSNYNRIHREMQMANNVLYYKEKYPHEKMILWAATYHAAKDLTKVRIKTPRDFKSMGAFLKESLGSNYYVIGFVAKQGKSGSDGALGLMKRNIKTRKNSIERYIDDCIKTEYAYVSLKSPVIQEVISKKGLNLVNLLQASTYKVETIQSVVDGLFYIENEKIVHYNY